MYYLGRSSSLVYYEKINFRKNKYTHTAASDYAKSLFSSKLYMHGHVVKLTVL